MYCSHCGTQMPGNAAFCPSCGRPSGAPLPGSSLSLPAVPGALPTLGSASAAPAGRVAYAGFWIRVLACFLDSIVMSIGLFMLVVVYAVTEGQAGVVIDSDDPALQNLSSLLSIPGAWLYSALMESSSWQATIGKRALGLRVTDEEGRRIGFGTATVRHIGMYLSAMILGVGFLMVAFSDRKQGLHDRLARTLVVK